MLTLTLTLASLLALGGVHHRGRGPVADRRRGVAFLVALVVLGAALASPLEEVAAQTLTGHAVQHLLLVLVAAPLLVVAEPGGRLLRGLPLPARRGLVRARRSVGATAPRRRWLHHPAVAFTALAMPTWTWHAAVPHEAAVTSLSMHVVEHATLLGGAWLFWHAVLRAVRDERTGTAVALLFLASLQGVLLATLMIFSGHAWYPVYADGAARFGVTALADQQLAGVLLWLPASGLYALTAVIVLARSVRDPDASPWAAGRPGGAAAGPPREPTARSEALPAEGRSAHRAPT